MTATLDKLTRFRKFISHDDATGCWPWTGYRDAAGYGRFHWDKQTGPVLAHRTAFTLLRGEIPEGLVLDHVCCTRACVNPDHLDPTTLVDNIKRGAERRTHCRNGHARVEGNTQWWNGQRYCIPCAHNWRTRNEEIE